LPEWLRVAGLFAVCVLAGLLAAWGGVPLAWMVAPMLVSAAVSLGGWRVRLGRHWRAAGQVIVASAVGAHFTPQALVEAWTTLHYIVFSALATVLGGVLVGRLLARVSRAHAATALYAVVPGGPAEMSQLASSHGGSAALVAAAQTLRIALIVLVIPLLLWLLGTDVTAATRAEAGPLRPLLLAAVLAAGALCALGCRRLGLVAAFFLAPLGVSALLSGFGVVELRFPFQLTAAGQILIGTTLGLAFNRAMFAEAPGFVALSTLMTLLMIGLGALQAWLISALSGLPLATLLLATAPGSVTEMSITAEVLGLGVATVAAFHIVRIFIILPLAAALCRTLPRVADDDAV
jgi:uncharacterized protein